MLRPQPLIVQQQSERAPAQGQQRGVERVLHRQRSDTTVERGPALFVPDGAEAVSKAVVLRVNGQH